MQKTLTTDQCKKKLFNLGIKFGVSPRLISTRLLSKEDKDDMLNGLVSDETLETAVQAWMSAGMPDYANGHTDPYKPPPENPMSRYRGNGKSG
jgi:hypothetical protein